jgi:hypothetical protein
MRYSEHSFYCCGCGQKGLPLMRPDSAKRERGHKKNLYCIYCKKVINHIECSCDEEVITFKENYSNGVYKEEKAVEDTVFALWDTRIR